MKELMEKRIEELKNAIAQSVANNAGLNGRLLEATWVLEQQIAIEAEEEPEVEIAMHAGEQL